MLAAFGLAIAAARFLKVLPPLIVLVSFIGTDRASVEAVERDRGGDGRVGALETRLVEGIVRRECGQRRQLGS